MQEVEAKIRDGFTRFAGPIELLDSIPGIDQTAAYVILAEIGPDMAAFPTAEYICSWARLAPGSHQSAKKTQGVTHGNNYLKTMLCEVAWVIAGQKKIIQLVLALKQRTDAKRTKVI